MRKMAIAGIIIGLVLLSVIAVVYAHGQENKGDEHDEWGYMDEMHEEMIENIDDPELREEIEEMHEECEEMHGNNMYGGHMMGWGMM